MEPAASASPDLPALPARPDDGHKGTFGRVLIVGGSETMLGAPVFAGLAALRCGSGLVQIAVPLAILPAALSVAPELIGLGLDKPRDDDALLEAAEKADVLVIGPGLGQLKAARNRLDALVRLEKAAVVDADALNLIAARKRWPKRFNLRAVLTPHPGEMGRLLHLLGPDAGGSVPADDEGRSRLASLAARTWSQTVLLKGHRTVIAHADATHVNTTGSVALAKAGSGDVLCGVIASLLGQGLLPFDAARLGAFLHGRAGQIAGERLGSRSVLARDVIDALGAALREREASTNGHE
jgi:NAD(P)H-hydrate epimerase